MKQKDIALIIIVGAIAALASFFVSRLIFVTPANRHQQVEVVQPISTTFNLPSSKYFNTKAIDPTQTIKIGSSNNPAPFSNATP